ncbi:hypothetical protein Lalb_Chr16g0390201 [Lupinus albus]|uniref:Uncharacterized protein n=1 Tax=Lupinus albus TaxID=3870 RepID=A0A6A4PDQ5_LUPAL|nr:hypothetical protein Lalb_Chr16g0390201 [Lupinus albus]
MMMQVCLIHLWVQEDHMELATFRIYVMYFLFKVSYETAFNILRFYGVFGFIMKYEL